jgi:hypothetical protein
LRWQMLWKTDSNGWGMQKVCLMNFGLELSKYSVQPFLIVFKQSQEMSSNWLSLTHNNNRLFFNCFMPKIGPLGPRRYDPIHHGRLSNHMLTVPWLIGCCAVLLMNWIKPS